jgi:Ca2+-binding RTX toxin-like protein
MALIISSLYFGENSMTVIWSPGSGATNGADVGVSNGVGPGDNFSGLGGDDSLVGNVGADTIIGALGRDTIVGGAGDDKLYGNNTNVTDTGSNTIYGDAGSDSISLGQFGDLVYGGADDDFIGSIQGIGRDTIYGGSGNDRINSYNGDDIVLGEDGNDNITGNAGNDTIDGQANNDILGGGEGSDLLYGGPGDDTLGGENGDDLLNGGAGQDRLGGYAGNDKFVFAFSQSSVLAPDRISDFTSGNDKIDLLTAGGLALPAPVGFTRAADTAATTLPALVASVFADANGAVGGSQPLGINAAVLVKNTANPLSRPFLIVNDGVAGFQSGSDLVILTEFIGTLPGFGAIPVGDFFV